MPISRAHTLPAFPMHHHHLSGKPPRPSASLSPTPRLMSPIELTPSRTQTLLLPPATRKSLPRSLTIRTPAPRRRLKPYQTPHHRARRSLARTTIHHHSDPQKPPIHPFDHLPWSAQLDVDPEDRHHLDEWDIADLSQLPDLPSPSYSTPTSTSMSGPVRRQRSSLRSHQRPTSPSPCDILFPFSPADVPSRPITPPSRFNPSRVLFHNLMPVLFDAHHDDSDHCTFKPPIHLH